MSLFDLSEVEVDICIVLTIVYTLEQIIKVIQKD